MAEKKKLKKVGSEILDILLKNEMSFSDSIFVLENLKKSIIKVKNGNHE